MNKITRLKPLLYGVLLCSLVAGCTTVGRKIDQNAVEKIEAGRSTKADVTSLIGSPDQISRNSDGTQTWTYLYIRVAVKGETFIPVFGAFVGGANTQNQTTTVRIGNAGIVSSVETGFGAMEVANGLSAGGRASIPEVESGKRDK